MSLRDDVEASMSTGALRATDPETPEDGAGDVATLEDGENSEAEQDEDQAFEKASAARGAQTIKSLQSMFGRRKPKEQLILLPAEAEAATAAVKLRARDLDVRLKRTMAWVVIIAVSMQLAVADFFLIHYVALSERAPSDAVLIAWLSASVVEVIGIVAIVARNLFPNRGKRRTTRAKDAEDE